MPKGTAGGSSNAREALEPGYAGPEAAVVAVEAPAAPAADVEVQPEPEPAEAVSEAPKSEPKPAPKVTVVGSGGVAADPAVTVT